MCKSCRLGRDPASEAVAIRRGELGPDPAYRTTTTRIQPIYEVPSDYEDILLFESAEAELTQDGKTLKGTLRILQQWAPMLTYAEFESDSAYEITFGEADVTCAKPKAKLKIQVSVIKVASIRGSCEGGVEVGTDHSLDKVVFHLPNYPDIMSDVSFFQSVKNGVDTVHSSWSQLVLEDEEWITRIQPHPKISLMEKTARSHRSIVLSGLGEITRRDGKEFKKKQIIPLLERLRVFLSFSLAEWMPPLFVVGSNAVAAKSCQMFPREDIVHNWGTKGWLDVRMGQNLSEAYPGFYRLWAKPQWRSPLTQAVKWLVQASREVGGVEGAVAFCQIPLEMLAWLVFVDDVPILDAKEFESLSAANKLHLLLHHCGISLNVPPTLKALVKITEDASKQKLSGPRIATEIRNTIIHPNKKNREKLEKWSSDYGVKPEELLRETQRLFKWYITLVILRLINYQGTYSDRLAPRFPGAVEPVPWASPSHRKND